MNTVKSLKWVPATSEIVERLFSRVSLVYNDYRKALSPAI